jgi:hypothetical protein
MLLAKCGEREYPLVQPHPTNTERIFNTLARSGGEAIEGHRDSESELGHRTSVLRRWCEGTPITR